MDGLLRGNFGTVRRNCVQLHPDGGGTPCGLRRRATDVSESRDLAVSNLWALEAVQQKCGSGTEANAASPKIGQVWRRSSRSARGGNGTFSSRLSNTNLVDERLGLHVSLFFVIGLSIFFENNLASGSRTP